MAAGISAVVSATDYGVNGQDKVTVFEVTPAGIGQIGTGSLGIIKDGGGFTITPMMRVKLSRLDSSNRQNPRLLQGLASYIETSQPAGTNRKDWNIRIQDVNLVGTAIGTPLNFAYGAVTQTYGDHIADIVAAVQAAYGAASESIDATSEVVSDPGLGAFAMPALEGGHPLNWYIDQINMKVYELSAGAYNMAYHYGSYDDVGFTTTFGGVVLFAYDSLLLPAAVATYNTTPGVGERGIRAGTFKRVLDATTLYVRRQGSYNTGSVTGYNSTANTDYPCPFSAGGWWKEPEKYDVATAAEAQALIDADIAANSNALETISFLSDGYIHMPGEVIAVTNPLEALVAEKYRVIRTRVIFKSGIHTYPLTEITAGLLPRGLGRGRNRTALRPVLRDTVPPNYPATAPTLLLNRYQGQGREAFTDVQLKTVNSISADIGAHRLRLVINSTQTQYSAWIDATGPSPTETTFPIMEVPAGASVSASVQARDTSYNVQPTYGPATVFTAAREPGPIPMSFDGHAAYDTDAGSANILGWNRSALTGTASAARNTSTVHFGKISLQLNVGSTIGDSIEYEGTPITAASSRVWEFMLARKATVASGTAAFLLRCYSSADVLVSTITVWSATPTTSFVEIDNASRVVTLPAAIAYFVPVLRYTSTGALSGLLWSIDVSRWAIVKTAESLDIGTDLAASRLFTLYDNSAPRVAKADLYYSSGSGDYVFTGRANIPMIWKDGYGNQMRQHSAGIDVTGIGDIFVSSGRLKINPSVKTATFTPDALNTLYYFSNSPTINLPTASGISGAMYAFVNTSTGTGTIDPNSTETVGGHTTLNLYRNASIVIVSDGTNWQIVAHYHANEGTAFPTTGLYDGFAYYRRDLRRWGFYDNSNTRWLSEPYDYPMHNYLSAPPYGTNNTEALAGGVTGLYAKLIQRWAVGFYVGPTLDGSNYWIVRLRRLTSGISVDTIVDQSTASFSPNVWHKMEVSSGFSNNPLNTTDIWLQVYLTYGAGTPSPIYIQSEVQVVDILT